MEQRRQSSQPHSCSSVYAFNIALLSKFLLKIHSHIFSEYCEELEWSSAGNTIIAGEVASGNVGLAGVVAGGCGEGGLGCRYIARQERYTLDSVREN